ncbi:molybdopterin converting factor subunit 1 [Sphingomonas bacterium]|uniref:molybdopterin converting factor subunit 1 n=1 Tax=Sphingomonas bacterium TaxID=1895847 RepID=UPI001575A788|nr:molybdopterin converting factor subunit 1 [Sphingomonas bacterium]
MAIEMLYFAWVRERIGLDREMIDPPDEVATVADLIAWLAMRSPGHAEALADPERLRAAIDQSFAGMEASIGKAREVALFPPVTGG